MDETGIKVRGRWTYLYRAIDNLGDTVDFFFSEQRDLLAAKRFIRKALKHHGGPDRIVIDGSQTNREAIISCDVDVEASQPLPWRQGAMLAEDPKLKQRPQEGSCPKNRRVAWR